MLPAPSATMKCVVAACRLSEKSGDVSAGSSREVFFAASNPPYTRRRNVAMAAGASVCANRALDSGTSPMVRLTLGYTARHARPSSARLAADRSGPPSNRSSSKIFKIGKYMAAPLDGGGAATTVKSRKPMRTGSVIRAS